MLFYRTGRTYIIVACTEKYPPENQDDSFIKNSAFPSAGEPLFIIAFIRYIKGYITILKITL